MKKRLAALLMGILVLASGCSPAAAPSGDPSSEADSSSLQSRPGGPAGDQRRAQGAAGGNRQAGVMGRIVAVSASEITLEIGVMGQREDAPSRPDGDIAPPSGDPQSGAARPQSGPPAGGGPRDPRGGGFPWSGDLEYSGEEASYALPETVTVTKGMGESSEELSVTDLAEGDVVLLNFDEAVRLISIQVLVLETGS